MQSLLRISEFFGFQCQIFGRNSECFAESLADVAITRSFVANVVITRFFCRECRDYALFGVQFYSEFWQKSCKNIYIIFDRLDITFKTKFSHRH